MPPTRQVSVHASLESLLAEKKALDAQIKAVRAANQHLPSNALKSLSARVARRVKAGASLDDALDSVLAELRAALLATLQERAE